MSALLDVRNVVKRFGGMTVLAGVTFSIEPRSITGILGPNGAGKTTLFNMISGFLPADRGDITYEGASLIGLKPHVVNHRGVARTFQIPRPFAGMSALENIVVGCLGPRARAGATASPQETASRLVDDVGLSDKKHLPVGVLSYGDLRRLEIARALASRPNLLLLDEPLAGLGRGESEPLLDLLNRLNRERGVAILLIEHKLSEFMRFVSRVIALDQGTVIADATPADVVRDPKVISAYLGTDGAEP